jgi:hypothetical protein
LRQVRVVAATLALVSIARADPLTAQAGPYDIPLAPTSIVPTAQGHARLLFGASPFGVAVTADGRASYDVTITLAGLPAPATLGPYRAFVAWAVSPDLSQWQRLGVVGTGTTTLGRIELNKFLLVLSAEARADVTTHAGPILLRGFSPSTWLQSFITHPMFRGVN